LVISKSYFLRWICSSLSPINFREIAPEGLAIMCGLLIIRPFHNDCNYENYSIPFIFSPCSIHSFGE